ncbi:MAG: TIGR01777 family oxidoreductase [Planctomycetes bacterium]|nr:TIGR01777 family oxidoreductase [Planctomycetota bacterium]
MRALVTGATGFIGRALVARLGEVVVVSRDAARAKQAFPQAETFAWDPMREPLPAAALRDVEVVFHLAGDSVAEGRWTAEKKRRIRESRTLGTANLVRGIEASTARPRVLVSASAVGYYGSRGDEVLEETSSPGHDFLADVCVEWEQSAAAGEKLGVRVANPRTGIVLGRGGGALSKMLLPFKLGAGGRLGSGRQWMPWIHLADLVGIFLHAATSDQVRGAINGVAPNPVTNIEFTKTLARALHRPAIMPAPEFALKLAIGEFAEVLLGSQRVVPRVAEQTGYRFQFPTLEGALGEILGAAT